MDLNGTKANKLNLNSIVQGLVGSGVVSGLGGGVTGGAVNGVLLSRKGRKHAGTLLNVGGLAWNDSRGLLLLRAMISAAMADGHIDVGEQTRIFSRLSELDLRDHEKSLILDELRHPARAEQLVEQCTDLATSLEVYAASILAVDTSCPAGRVYLDDLAEQLALPPVLARNVQEQTLPSAGNAGYGTDCRAGRDSGQDRAA